MLPNLRDPNNAAKVTETFLAENHDDPTAKWVAGRVLTAWGKKNRWSDLSGVLFAGVLLAFLVFSFRSSLDTASFDKELYQKHDTPAVALITGINEARESRGENGTRKTCQLESSYTANGEEFEVVHPVLSPKLCQRKVGNEIKVTYDSADPSKVSIQERSIQKARGAPWMGFVFLILILGMGALATVHTVRIRKLTRSLVADSPPTPPNPQAVPRLATRLVRQLRELKGGKQPSDEDINKALGRGFRIGPSPFGETSGR